MEDFINADTYVIAHEELSDEDMGSQMKDKEESDGDEAPDLPPSPDTACVLKFDAVRNCMAANDDDVPCNC